jgi:hypothetical protein
MRCLDLGIADHGEVVPQAGTTHQEAKIHTPFPLLAFPVYLVCIYLQFLI